MSPRARIALSIVVLAALAAVLAFAFRTDTATEPAARPPAVVHFDDGALRYTYHVPTGDEGLFDLAADPKLLRNLRDERPADVKRLREALTKKLDVKSLEELRAAHRETIERLKSLGYL